jgi:hypothetical protein
MDFLSPFTQEALHSHVEGIQKLVKDNRVKERILEEAQDYAQRAANFIHDPQHADPIQPIPPVPIDSDPSLLEYCLVLDYLDSVGLKFAPIAFRHEAQHPNQFADRVELARMLGLRPYDRTPLLVQMIDEKRKSQGKWG